MNMDVTSGCGGGSGISASLPDEFSPAGLRVLAVDDDAVCLAMLGQTLRQCQYQVTTTNHALKALRILTERKDEFDIVISDVNMPDMSGLELLDVIKVEMDIPVILVSGHSETELVEKGVERGAVDYLLKPVRMEEMMNIWQHVVRRKKMRDSTSPSLSQRLNVKVEEGGEGGGDGDGREESNGGGEGEEGKKEKKARVVWNEDLHQKFVRAVNRLGYDKAVPKRILDMMNVEGLTRENVASHLQKYRIYLKRMNTEHNLANPLGSEASSSSLSAASLIDGFDEFRSSITPASLPGSLNSLSGLAFGEIPSSGFLQPTCNQVQQQQPFLPTGQNPGFGHVPTMAGLASTSANPPMLLHQLQQHGLGVSSLDQDSFGVGQFFSPSLLDSSRCDAIWEPAAAVDQLLPNFGSSQFVEQVAHEESSSLLPATMECNYCMPFSGPQVSSTEFGCMNPESHAGEAGQAGLIGNVIEGLSNTSLNSSFGEVGFQYGCGVDQRRSFDGSSSAAGQFGGRVSPPGFDAQNGFAGCGGSFDAVDGTTMAGMTNKEHNNDDHMIFDGVFGSDAYRRLQ